MENEGPTWIELHSNIKKKTQLFWFYFSRFKVFNSNTELAKIKFKTILNNMSNYNFYFGFNKIVYHKIMKIEVIKF